MIDVALELVRRRLDDHLKAKFGTGDSLVALSPLLDEEGKPAAEARNRLVLFLVNIAEDAVPRGRTSGTSRQVVQAEPVHLDIYLMLASGHDADIYSEGLKLVSAAMMFFQSNPVFTPQNTPDMADGLSQLALEISNLRSEELGQLWGNLGGRYVPSVMYKMRSVMIDGQMVQRVEPLIRRPGQTVKPEAVS